MIVACNQGKLLQVRLSISNRSFQYSPDSLESLSNCSKNESDGETSINWSTGSKTLTLRRPVERDGMPIARCPERGRARVARRLTGEVLTDLDSRIWNGTYCA